VSTAQHALAQNKAKKIGQAVRSGEGGGRVSPDYGNPTRTLHAEEAKAERSGQAERSEKGGSGPPQTTAIKLARRTPKKA
jgi:hypothetical protein